MHLTLRIGGIELFHIQSKPLEAPKRKFNPCWTCRHAFLYKDTETAGCAMFSMHRNQARMSETLCGRYGEAWEPKGPEPQSIRSGSSLPQPGTKAWADYVLALPSKEKRS